jgi:replicative DNA helicase
LRDSDAVADALEVVQGRHFYADAHQRVFAAVVALWEAAKPVDLVTVAEELRRRGDLADVPYTLLTESWDEGSVLGSAAARHLASKVRDLAAARDLVRAGAQIQHDALEASLPAPDLMARAEAIVYAVAEGCADQAGAVTLGEILPEAIARIDARQRRDPDAPVGVLTGLADLDALTSGLQDCELVVCGARPSCGKTALGLTIAWNAAARGQGVYFASLEQSRVEVFDRLLCMVGGVDSGRLRKGMLSSSDVGRLAKAQDRLQDAPFHVEDTPAPTALQLLATARRLKRKAGIRLVVVDYLQLVAPEDRRETREQQVSGVSRKLKFIAKELKLPVLALAQLNRESEHRPGQRPRLADLRESGGIEADADGVYLLHRPDANTNRVELIVAKQRNGPTGDVDLAFHREFVRFENYVAAPAYVAAPGGYGDEL